MKKVLSSIVCMCMILCMMTTLPVSVSAKEGMKITHNFPASVKVGQYVSGAATVHNVAPKENLYSSYVYFQDTNDEYWSTVTISLAGVGGGEDPEDSYQYADENGTLTLPNTFPVFTYKPGNLIGEVNVFRNSMSPTVEHIKIKIEQPEITHNAPSSVKTGTSINFKTSITNTAYTNSKISDRKDNTPYYTPAISVIEGKDIVKQSKQDYSNTLSTSETLTFNKTGTVKLKITYRPTVYQRFSGSIPIDKQMVEDYLKSSGYEYGEYTDNSALIYLDGSIEKTITINVTNNNTHPSASNIPSQKPSSSTQTQNSSSSSTTSGEPSAPTHNEQPVTIADEATGIKINADNSVVPEGTTMIANAITEGEQLDKVKEAIKDVSNRFSAFDLSLEKDNVKIQPTGKVTVSIPIPSGYDQSRLAIYYIADDGTKTELPSTIQENNISFETDHFSTYVVAEKLAAPTNASGAEKNNATLWIVLSVVGGILLLGAGGAVWFFKFRKKPSENE